MTCGTPNCDNDTWDADDLCSTCLWLLITVPNPLAAPWDAAEALVAELQADLNDLDALEWS